MVNLNSSYIPPLTMLKFCISITKRGDIIYFTDKNGSTNVFFKLPGDGALNNLPPDQTVYLAYDMYFKEHSSFYHSKYYPKQSDGIYTQDKYGSVATPQFNNISFHVIKVKIY